MLMCMLEFGANAMTQKRRSLMLSIVHDLQTIQFVSINPLVQGEFHILRTAMEELSLPSGCKTSVLVYQL